MEARTLLGELRREHARFARLVVLRVGSAADAEDVLQKAYARAAERADRLRDPARARPWFYRILRNAVADHHRASHHDPLRHAGSLDEDAAGEAPDRRTPCACGLRLLAEMRPAYAELVRRIDVESEEPADVARALGVTVGNLHVRLHRARKALRDDVKTFCGVDSLRPCLDCGCGAGHRCGG